MVLQPANNCASPHQSEQLHVAFLSAQRGSGMQPCGGVLDSPVKFSFPAWGPVDSQAAYGNGGPGKVAILHGGSVSERSIVPITLFILPACEIVDHGIDRPVGR